MEKKPPQAFTLHLQVDHVDSWRRRAVDAGCTVNMPLEVQFWGDKYGQLRDPFVHGLQTASPTCCTTSSRTISCGVVILLAPFSAS
jgi:hypothetical protein